MSHGFWGRGIIKVWGPGGGDSSMKCQKECVGGSEITHSEGLSLVKNTHTEKNYCGKDGFYTVNHNGFVPYLILW